jgi:hypothetical protein
VALAFSWAVATVGLGAVVKSRIGVSRLSVQFGRFGGDRFGADRFGGYTAKWGASSSTGVNEVQVPVSWQTPTPVQGVVAAPRPQADGQAGSTGL